jgi:phosphoribosyl 1,2-cyclic phosphodiesterase
MARRSASAGWNRPWAGRITALNHPAMGIDRKDMTGTSYKLRFWGVRGSIPTPSPRKMRYGGNTSCLAMDLGGDEHLILDCGTGLRRLGNELAPRTAPQRFHIFLTHYHLDHVLGLPFFHPLYNPESQFTVHSFTPPGTTVGEALAGVMSPPYFPLTLKNVPAEMNYVDASGKSFPVRDLVVRSLALNHPNGALGYRLDHGDRRVVYATDHEHGNDAVDAALVEFARGADYLIYDTTYEESEYEKLRRGWGHSTWYAAVQCALKAEAKQLILFHHHPEHTDDELERLVELAREEMPATVIAAEGMELEF